MKLFESKTLSDFKFRHYQAVQEAVEIVKENRKDRRG
jgi:hypothetical protein